MELDVEKHSCRNPWNSWINIWRNERNIDRITNTEKSFVIRLEDGTEYETSFVLNASYASVNQILQKLENVGTEKFKIKYELCEIILCKPTEKLKPIGLPKFHFFSFA